VTLGYEHLSTNEALRALLPPEVTVPSGFETVGQVAHFNLREEHMPYRYLIGEVVLEVGTRQKSHVRTVVTKLSSISNTFRTFDMEVIAGERNTEVEVTEGACRFVFDFAKVYWSSKLQHEREVVLQELRPGQVVCDMFAGVGPLALRAAKQGCYVVANDLNPEGAAGLIYNAQKNKVVGRVACFNLDARDFVRQLVRTPRDDSKPEGLTPTMASLPATFHHVYMNLPKDAIEFLDVFSGLFSAAAWPELPIIHVYGFSASTAPKVEFLQRISQVWGEVEIPDFRVRKVRDISPRKYVYCLTFTLPREIAFGQVKRPGEEIDEGASKHPPSSEQPS
jgi:tRNA (guanine37-N1)-methyltransferase